MNMIESNLSRRLKGLQRAFYRLLCCYNEDKSIADRVSVVAYFAVFHKWRLVYSQT